MSVKETAAVIPTMPEPVDVTYKWTHCGISRKPDQVNLPLAEQSIILRAKSTATVDGADSPMDDREIKVVMTTDELLALPAAAKSIIKAFIGLCEKGCKNADQTYIDDAME